MPPDAEPGVVEVLPPMREAPMPEAFSWGPLPDCCARLADRCVSPAGAPPCAALPGVDPDALLPGAATPSAPDDGASPPPAPPRRSAIPSPRTVPGAALVIATRPDDAEVPISDEPEPSASVARAAPPRPTPLPLPDADAPRTRASNCASSTRPGVVPTTGGLPPDIGRSLPTAPPL